MRLGVLMFIVLMLAVGSLFGQEFSVEKLGGHIIGVKCEKLEKAIVTVEWNGVSYYSSDARYMDISPEKVNLSSLGLPAGNYTLNVNLHQYDLQKREMVLLKSESIDVSIDPLNYYRAKIAAYYFKSSGGDDLTFFGFKGTGKGDPYMTMYTNHSDAHAESNVCRNCGQLNSIWDGFISNDSDRVHVVVHDQDRGWLNSDDLMGSFHSVSVTSKAGKLSSDGVAEDGPSYQIRRWSLKQGVPTCSLELDPSGVHLLKYDIPKTYLSDSLVTDLRTELYYLGFDGTELFAVDVEVEAGKGQLTISALDLLNVGYIGVRSYIGYRTAKVFDVGQAVLAPAPESVSVNYHSIKQKSKGSGYGKKHGLSVKATMVFDELMLEASRFAKKKRLLGSCPKFDMDHFLIIDQDTTWLKSTYSLGKDRDVSFFVEFDELTMTTIDFSNVKFLSIIKVGGYQLSKVETILPIKPLKKIELYEVTITDFQPKEGMELCLFSDYRQFDNDRINPTIHEGATFVFAKHQKDWLRLTFTTGDRSYSNSFDAYLSEEKLQNTSFDMLQMDKDAAKYCDVLKFSLKKL